MLIKEFRIILPLSVEEYQVAQLYTVAEASKEETGGGDGVEVIHNHPFNENTNPPTPPLLNGDPQYVKGQYTLKNYHLAQKVPGIVRALCPTNALILGEEAWNAYPYCRTVLTNLYFTEAFRISIETLHSGDINLSNAHQLSPEELKKREVIYINIAEISPDDKDYKPTEDPTTFHSTKTGRGPLSLDWVESYAGPVMCAYKLVRCLCKIRFVQGKLESIIQQQERRLFANFHRQVFCWMDMWYGLTMNDIRRIEEETRLALEEQRRRGSFRGHVGYE